MLLKHAILSQNDSYISIGFTVIGILLLVSDYQLLLSTVHDSVVYLHEVLVVEKWSFNIVWVYLILQKVKIRTSNDGYIVNHQTLAACLLLVVNTPYHIYNVWYLCCNFCIVASRCTYMYRRIRCYRHDEP